MIGQLRGTLVHQDDTRVIVECAGVGYLAAISTHTMLSLPPVGEQVTLRVFTHAQENKIALYGFGSAEERALFDLLITVKNVGPASAMGILSGGAGPAEIAEMVADGNSALLTKIKGVGKKTAELIVVELREKCEFLLATWAAAGKRSGAGAAGEARAGTSVIPPRRPARPAILEDVASALEQLGWKPAEVDRAVGELEITDGATLESLLRRALRSMPR